MRLPLHTLTSVDYYETTSTPYQSDTLIIHWKAWYKRKSVFRFTKEVSFLRYDTGCEDSIYSHRASCEYIELKKQLDEYFAELENK